MPIRPATWSDLLPASQVACRAFFDEAFFGPFLHPYRHEYPGDVYLYFLRSLRTSFFDAATFIFVSHPAGSPHAITGLSVWDRAGHGGNELRAKQPVLQWIAGRLMGAFNAVHSFLYPDRSVDASKLGALEESEQCVRHYFEVPHRVEAWMLARLATDPDVRGQGYGRELLEWGMRKAREDGIVAGLLSSVDAETFYQRCGFGKPVGYATEGEDNPLKDVPGGAIMFLEDHMKH